MKPWEFVCPKGWEVIERWGDGFAVREIGGGLRVLIDCAEKEDGNHWVHVSFSRKSWTPNHADTVKIKDAFIGDRYAYVVYPPSSEYVNIHSHCLHLWSLWTDEDRGRVLPEFSANSEELMGVKSI